MSDRHALRVTTIGGAAAAKKIDWQQHIMRHLCPDGSVIIPPRIAKWLDQQVNMLSEQRIMLRTSDPEAFAVLSALHLSALGHQQNVFRAVQQPQDTSASGHHRASDGPFEQQSHRWLTTPQASRRIGVHERALRRWITEQRLPARKHGGRWLIDQQQLEIAQALTA